MKVSSMLVRAGALLPKRLNLLGTDTFAGWVSIEHKSASEIQRSVRSRGWHFMWLNQVAPGLGVALTAEGAMEKAVRNALDRLKPRFNTAEVMMMRSRKYPGFYVAHAELASRHVQECASLGLVDEAAFRDFPAGAEKAAVWS